MLIYGPYCETCPRIQELEMLNERLREENEALREELGKYRKDVEVLEEKEKMLLRKVNMNSGNSSKPPSTDGFSLR